MAIIVDHNEIPVEEIAVKYPDKTEKTDRKHRKQALMRIVRACAGLPTLDGRSADGMLGYESSDAGLRGDN